MKDIIHEIVVVGGGLMGSSAAWQLSKLGKQVVLIEQQSTPYENGSSKGESRIVRGSNIENDTLWSYLHNSSVKEVEALVQFLNQHQWPMTMEAIYTTSPVSYIAKHEALAPLLKNLEKQKVKFEVASTPEEGLSKFGVQLEEGTFLQREYNTHSGTLNPKVLIEALHKGIALKGNQLWYQTKIASIDKKAALYHVRLRTADGASHVIRAKQVVCAAGPYTGPLLKKIAPDFEKLISPQRVFLAFLQIKKEAYARLTEKQQLQLRNGFPVIDRAIDNQSEEFYAMIEKFDAEGNPIIKIGGHYHRTAMPDPDQVWHAKLSQAEIAWAIQKMSGYLNFLKLPILSGELKLVDEYSCMYSLTPTEVPFVTPIQTGDRGQDENVVVMAGMSGVGAKGAMAYGRIAAQMLTGQKPQDAFYEVARAKLGYDRLTTQTL